MTTADDAGTRAALSSANCSFKEIEIVEATLAHDQPGSLAKAARRLADAGINIEAVFPSGMQGNQISVGFVTNNPAKAREILSAASAAR